MDWGVLSAIGSSCDGSNATNIYNVCTQMICMLPPTGHQPQPSQHVNDIIYQGHSHQEMDGCLGESDSLRGYLCTYLEKPLGLQQLGFLSFWKLQEAQHIQSFV